MRQSGVLTARYLYMCVQMFPLCVSDFFFFFLSPSCYVSCQRFTNKKRYRPTTGVTINAAPGVREGEGMTCNKGLPGTRMPIRIDSLVLISLLVVGELK